MKMKWKMAGFAALAALALHAVPASAQVKEHTSEFDVYGGELFGDKITDVEVSGRKPELDDDLTFGLRYAYNFTDAWGLDLSVGNTASKAANLVGKDIDFDLVTVDVDAVWHFLHGSRFAPYLVGGAGYARSNLDDPILGTVDGRAVKIEDDGSFTANAGIGAKYFITDRFLIRGEARYRYVDSVVNRFAGSLNTFETTLGIGWQF